MTVSSRTSPEHGLEWRVACRAVARRSEQARLRVALRRYGAASFACIMSEGWWTRFVPDGTACSTGSNWSERPGRRIIRPAQR